MGDNGSRIETEYVFPADGYYRMACKANPANWLSVSDDASRLTTVAGTNIATGSELAYAEPSTVWRITEQSDLTYRLTSRGVSAASATGTAAFIPTTAGGRAAQGFSLIHMEDDTWTIRLGSAEDMYIVNSESQKETDFASGVVTGSQADAGNSARWYIFTADDFYLPLTQTDASGATYAAAYLPFGYVLPSDADGYTVTVNETDATAEAHKLQADVPASTAVLVVSPEGSETALVKITTTPRTILDSNLHSSNQLNGTFIDADAADRDFALVFSGTPAAFFPVSSVLSDGKLRAYTAFLPSSAVPQTATALPLSGIDMSATSVDTPVLCGDASSIYDLQGRRVAKAQKGIYIIGGKKKIVR